MIPWKTQWLSGKRVGKKDTLEIVMSYIVIQNFITAHSSISIFVLHIEQTGARLMYFPIHGDR